ncbi:MAG: PDZ domain-containing protein [Candidatus Acidiferrales bacterium]
MNRLWALGILIVAFANPAAATIDYRISLKNPEQHLFQVRMTIPNPAPGTQIAIPAWNALYQVRDFSYRVRDVHGIFAPGVNESAELLLQLQKVDKQTWNLGDTGKNAAEVSYTIEWDDPGPFNSQLNEHHAFVNFAEVLMYVPDRRSEAVSVEFDDVPSEWHSVAELPAGAQSNSFTADSYDKLVDAPVEIGKTEEFAFDQSGARIRVVVDGKDWKKDRLEDYLKRITKSELDMMGGPPFQQYTFFFHLGSYPEVGGGGMEHANCTAISAPSVESAATTAAHEFFHVWNVKRIRPQTLEPVDFTKEQYTRALWFAEGVTSTYGAYTLERTGLWTNEQFYADLASQISELESRAAHTWQSVEESSLDAWLEKYDDYRTPARSISYYNKGQIVGEMLDLAIRGATDDHKSLDDLMRAMYAEYPQKGKFYHDSAGVESVAEQIAGRKFDVFFEKYVAGTWEIPYDEFLSAAGLTLKVEDHVAADLGFWTAGRGPGVPVRVTQVEQGSPAQAAGLRAGDVLISMNGGALPRYFPSWMHEQTPGEKISLRVHRDEKDIDLEFVLGQTEEKRYSIAELHAATEKQKKLRNAWLSGKTE